MSESNAPKNGGLWARLMNLQDDGAAPKPPGETAAAEAVPTAQPVASPADEVFSSLLLEETPIAAPMAPALDPALLAQPLAPAAAEPVAEVQVEQPEADVVPAPCACCGAARNLKLSFCEDCGWLFPEPGAKPAATPRAAATAQRDSTMSSVPKSKLKDRYEVGDLISDREGMRRYHGTDATTGQSIVIVAAEVVAAALPLADDDAPVAAVLDDEILPGFDDDVPVAVLPDSGTASWPSLAWERALLEKADHPALPHVIDQFTDGSTEYLIEEAPAGKDLWDAWYEPDTAIRYGWLQEIAGALHALHKAGALLEGIRPDLVRVSDAGQPVIVDLSDLLPLPLPSAPPIRATLYTAPELILAPQSADARADLYSFGAMLYSLEYLNHALEEKDFERQFSPRQISDRFPDVHPLLLRLVNKTFVRDVNTRFPTDEAQKTDPSGFGELIKTLEVCKKTFDLCRLDFAAWTTTGMVRTGNEDALAFLHGVETRQDELYEYAMVLLCDGMGGYEAGEVAAAMAIAEMRKYLLAQPLFSALTGKEPPTGPVEPKAYQAVLAAALKHANKEVFTASRTPGGKERRGMGCTAECVYIDSRHVIVGHVGDSRTYHLHAGRLVQMTRDQTLVNRLVELGQLSAEEAEHHPRKNELQQAIGGQPDVMPGTYIGKLQRGDWVLVCSDGLTNHISNTELEKMMAREAAGSAEEAARRLLNLVNLRGATDNATIVVVRAT